MKAKLVFGLLILSSCIYAQRTIYPLNGLWEIEDGVSPDKQPVVYRHSVQVPGLSNMATPAFPDADRYGSKEYLTNEWIVKAKGKFPGIDTIQTGVSFQVRNYFWYRKVFQLKQLREVVILKVNKAQFGTKVWVNGKPAGEYLGCFTAGYFDISSLVKKGKNMVVIRIGAHPGVLPPSVPAGTDFEKQKWTPGIYDEVSLIATSNTYIENLQLAPDIIHRQVRLQYLLVNKGPAKTISPLYIVIEKKGGETAGSRQADAIQMGANSTLLITDSIPINNMHLWSPEDPFLYRAEIQAGADDMQANFGMRSFSFDTRTRKAYLNGKIYYLRGSNITLHRFFEDSLCKGHPWEDAWVKKLLIDLPKSLNWNCFRFCIGPVPDRWLALCDEYGMLVQNEYFIWSYRASWDKDMLTMQVKEWMRDNWNHPSVAWWDICNETNEDKLAGIIGEVRSLDLSGRAWDNGYHLPQGGNDPVEDHHYLQYGKIWGDPWTFEKFEDHVADITMNAPHPTAHTCVLNEYGWLWIHRDGRPTALTESAHQVLTPGMSGRQRQDYTAWLVGAETEYFRAYRNYAGVMHFTWLTCDYPMALTCDPFANIDKLELVPAFEESLRQAFKPVGVYINFWKQQLPAAGILDVPVMMVNDYDHAVEGTLICSIENENGEVVSLKDQPFHLADLSQQTYVAILPGPLAPGNYVLKALAKLGGSGEPTLSRRFFKVEVNKR